MNIMNWNPKFSIYKIENFGAIFVSSDEYFSIDSDAFINVNEAILKKHTPAEFAMLDNDFDSQIQKIRTLEELEEKGLLGENHLKYQLIPDDFINKKIGTSEFYLKKDCSFQNEIANKVSVLNPDPNWRFIITTDVQSSDVKRIVRHLEAEGQGFSIIVPYGSKCFISPYFKNGQGSACYECFTHSLNNSTPVINWLRSKVGVDIKIPTYENSAIFKIIDSYFSESRNLYLNRYSEPTIELLDVNLNFLCSKHGEKLSPRKVILSDIYFVDNTDGGYRSISRNETLDRVMPFVNPITGFISELEEISQNEDLKIYRSAYYLNYNGKQLPNEDSFVELSLGKGSGQLQSKCSAIGEAFERKAGQFYNNEKIYLSSTSELDLRYYLPADLCEFSDIQMEEFALADGPSKTAPQWVKPYDKNDKINWTKVWSLTKSEFVYMPTTFCFGNTPFENDKYSMYCHNGNACGSSIEEAILQGLFEVVERDAVSIWWYNQVAVPGISQSILSPETRHLVDNALGEEWDYWLLDVTNDTTICTVVAVAQNKYTREISLGFGAHFDTAIAATRAITELYQLVTIKDKVTGPFDFNKIRYLPYLQPHANRRANKKLSYSGNNIKEAINLVVECLAKIGVETCVLDYSRKHLPLKTVKVITPGLCHFWPRYRTKRLYQTPLNMGWLEYAHKEGELNPLELYL
ncbi:hypothetical protein FLM44_05365 [Pseudoalteromonas luteoviolacea]|nr:hypothetical protein FLM44_05365 [Pseudoalteromonas luteoviolacea]